MYWFMEFKQYIILFLLTKDIQTIHKIVDLFKLCWYTSCLQFELIECLLKANSSTDVIRKNYWQISKTLIINTLHKKLCSYNL